MYDDYDDDDYGYQGDARVCPTHPWITTSSHNGMFDCPCGVCESNMEELGPPDLKPDLEPDVEYDPIVARRMGKPVYLSDVDDDDVPF